MTEHPGDARRGSASPAFKDDVETEAMTKMNKSVASMVLVGGAAGLAACVWLGLRGEAASSRGGTAPAENVKATAQARSSSGALGCRFQPGDRLGYTLSSQTVYGLSSGVGGSVNDKSTALFKAVMHLRVLDASPGDAGSGPSYTFAGMFSRPSLSQGGEPLPADGTAAALGAPVLFRMDASCRVTEVATQSSMPVVGRNQWKLTLKLLEFAVPAPGTASSWTTRQSDGLGAYSATYRRTDGPRAEITLRRGRVAYHELHQNDDRRVSANVVRSAATARFLQGKGWFEHAKAEEHAILKMSGKTMADVNTTIEAGAIDVADAQGQFWTEEFDRARYAFGPADVLEKDETRLPYADRPPIEGLGARSLDSVLTEIEAGLAKKQGTPEYDKSLNLLVQYLRLDPGKPRALLAQLQRSTAQSPSRPVLFLALQLTGGKEAHEVLDLAAHDARLSTLDRERAISALSDVPDPNTATVASLMDMRRPRGDDAEDIANTTNLALGALANNPRLDPQGKETILTTLAGDLSSAQSPEDAVIALGAIGNARDASLRDRVMEWTVHEEPMVQAAAYSALRNLNAMPEPVVMIDALIAADSPHLRSALTECLISRKLGDEDLARVATALRGEPAPEVRASFIRILGYAVAYSAFAKATLVEHAKVEPDPDLLVHLGRYLKGKDLL